MADINFKLVGKSDKGRLYQYSVTDANAQEYAIYFLLASASSNKDVLTLAETWNGMRGGYLFLPLNAKIANTSNFINDFLSNIEQTVDKWIAWVSDPANVKGAYSNGDNLIILTQTQPSSPYYKYQVAKASFATLGNLGMSIPSQATVTITTENGLGINFKVADLQGGANFTLKGGASSQNSGQIPVNENGITLPFGSNKLGAIQYELLVDRGAFYQLFIAQQTFNAAPSGEMRFTYGAPDSLTTIRYPIFLGVESNTQKKEQLINLISSLDPLLPDNGKRSFFAIKPNANYDALSCEFYNDTTGTPITLAPSDDGGFGLGWRPVNNDAATRELYLLPNGKYQVNPSVTSSTAAKLQAMCGIIGTEFLLLAEGDYIEFGNTYIPLNESDLVPAVGHAPNYPLSGSTIGKPVDLLDGKTTTGWMKVVVGPYQEKVFGASAVFKESYCVQSLGAVFFKESGTYYSTAIGCRLADLSTKIQKPFPMVPYQGVYSSNNSGFENPNQNVEGTAFESFELEVISPNRRRQMQPDECLGPLFFDMENNQPLSGGYVRTAQGMLVKLNDGTSVTLKNGKTAEQPAGTWNNLILAKSPIKDNQFLTIGVDDNDCSEGLYDVVNPQLSNSLMNNAPFVVITQDKFGTHNGDSSFANELQMGEFTFLLDVARNAMQSDASDYTIIIFKLGKGNSVQELSTATSRWTNPDYFVGTDEIDPVSKQINTLITEAKTTDQTSIFYDFYTKMINPEWTGMIAMNCSLDYSALPIDLKMLLGGIDGQLMAHHFGITVNHIDDKILTSTDSNTIPINNSSLFGLVHYSKELKADPPADKNLFQVLKLNALFVNSALSHFDSKIAMTIPKLFEEHVKLSKGSAVTTANVIEINGVYQKPTDPNKKVGKVVFNTDKKFVFDFGGGMKGFRALDKMVAVDAALSPVSDTPDGSGNSTIISHFSMGGGIGFVPSIGNDPNNPDNPAVDIFSFAITDDYKSKGLGVTDYNLQMSTVIKSNNTASLSPDIPTRYDEIRMAVQTIDGVDQSRPNSFFATFPIKFVGFKYNTSASGLSASSLSGRQMIMDKFGSKDKFSGPLKNVAPNFGLMFKINIGSLGGLVSDKNILEAEVFMGWTAAQSDAEANQVGMIFIPPKGISSDGSFKIQGVFNAFYGDILLDRYPQQTGLSKLLFVITLKDVNFLILSIPLIPSTWERALTFFGDPLKPKGNNLNWFVGNPSHDPKPDDSNGTVDVSFIAKPFMGLMSGLDLKTDPTSVQVIGPTINSLFTVPTSTMLVINNIASGNTGSVVNYNPNAGLLFWLEIDFSPISLKLLFDDPSLYGGVIKVGPPKKKKQEPDGEEGGEGGGGEGVDEDGGGGSGGGDGEKGLLDTWGGLELIFIYRKINDNLGEYSAEFTLPESLSNFNLGEVEITLPSFGLSYFTNGDWKATVGWPFASTTSFAPGAQQLKLVVLVLGVPVEFVAGFYLAKLRSEDAPSEFGTEFGLIWMFGIGLGGGLGFKESLGPASLEVSLLLWVTLEAMLGSKQGDITANGVDYYWFAGQVGLTANITGKVDFVIISASIEIEATLVVTLAIETGHRTEVRAAAQLKIEVKVHIIFFTISFRFKADVTIGKFDFGPKKCPDGSASPIAQVDKPSVTVACGYKSTALTDTSMFEDAMLESLGSDGLAAVMVDTSISNITLYFAIQPTAAYDTNAFKPYGVASLLIASNTGEDFTTMTQGIGNWMYNKYKGTANDFPTQIKNVLKNIDAFQNDIMTALSDLFTFEIKPRTDLTNNPNVAVFPIIPGLDATYDKTTKLDFAEHKTSAEYVKTIEDYFNNTSHIQSNKARVESAQDSTTTMGVFENYFGMIGKNLFEDILDMTEADKPPTTMTAAYAQLTAKDKSDGTGFQNISGMVSRFMLHGLQLPVSSSDHTLKPLYELTNQQIELTEKGGVYNTEFELMQGSAPSWVKLSKTPLIDDLDKSLILSDVKKIDTSWTKNAKPISPLVSFTQTFNFTHSVSWTDASGTVFNMRSMPDGLRNIIRTDLSSLDTNTLVLKQIPGTSGTSNDVTDLPTVNTIAALLAKFTLKQIPDLSNPGQFLDNVYQVKGTDEATREMIQSLLDDSGSSINKISLLTATASGQYTSAAKESTALLARTNLSTDSIPDGVSLAEAIEADALDSTSPLGPVQAKLTATEAKNFLRLIWEVSIVHTQGFYLAIDGLDKSLFKNQEASVSLLAELESTMVASQKLKPYFNTVIAAGDQVGNAMGGFLVDTTNNKTLLTYRSNYLPGYTGFTINSQTPATPSVKSDPNAYLATIYHFIQYKVKSISGDSGFTATNWSTPLGAKSEPIAGDMLEWTFRQSIPVPMITKSTNRYQYVGSTVNVEARVLDMYGNAHPDTWDQSLVVAYNDPILTPAEWQGIQFYFEVTSVNQAPQLNLSLTYDPGGIKKKTKETDNAPSQLKQTIAKYQLIYDQLTDPNVTANIATSLASGDFTSGVNGKTYVKELADFVNSILNYLKSNGSSPSSLTLSASLEAKYIAGLSDDIIELDVHLTIERDKSKVDPSVYNQYKEVQSASTIVPPYVASSLNNNENPASGLIPFAQKIEAAYKAYAGPNSYIKIAQGPKMETATGGTSRQVYAVRWGQGTGINVDVPNSQNPSSASLKPNYYAPPPLSTVLLNDTFDGLYTYDPTTGAPVKTDITKTFNNVDLDTWARYFINEYHGLLSAEMSTAIAQLDELDTSGTSQNFLNLLHSKQNLADYISGDVTNIIDFTGVTPDPAKAKEVFEQALLASLTEDYETSVIVQIPTTVSVKGSTPAHAPRLYGKIATNEPPVQDVVKNYTISNGSLEAKNASENFAFLLDSKRPEEDAFLPFKKLFFDIGFIEYKFEENETEFGFTPSTWLTFVLPDDDVLKIDLGAINAPIPLREYPPAPVLVSRQQVNPMTPPTTIQGSLNWDFQLVVGKPMAEQDQLNLKLTFNESIDEPDPSPQAMLMSSGRPAPKDLSEALGRFIYEYPQLAPSLPSVISAADGNNATDQANARAIIADIVELVMGIAGVWSEWKNPGIKNIEAHNLLHSDEPMGSIYDWNYSIINKISQSEYIVTRGDSTSPWPNIDGSPPSSISNNQATYSSSGSSNEIQLSFTKLFVLTHQSVNVSSFIVRNEDLGNATTGQTNPAFVYTTESIRFPTLFIPLIENATPIKIGNGNLQDTLMSLFELFFTDPANSANKVEEVKFSLSAETKFTLAKEGSSNTVSARTPVLFSSQTVGYPTATAPAIELTAYIKNLVEGINKANAADQKIFLVMTIFSNITTGQLPLVIYSEIDLETK